MYANNKKLTYADKEMYEEEKQQKKKNVNGSLKILVRT